MARKYILGLAIISSVILPLVICDNPLSSYEVLLSWKTLEYKWPAPQTRERLLATKEYIPENNVITGIKVSGSKIYLTVPRWRLGVPSTLNVVDLNQKSGPEGAPYLVPYPNWDMQQVGNCNAFQYVQSMEIDRWGRMWVVDVGRVNIFKNKETKCKAKVVLIDLESDEVLHKYEFPEEVVSQYSNFLNDVVVECEGDGGSGDRDNCFAYITDAKDGKLVVYNLKEGRSWFVRHRSMMADPEALKMDILGGNYTFNVNIDGIALSPRSSGHDRVYYCPLSSFSLFSVSTKTLKESVNGVTLRDSDVTTHAKHSSQKDGLAMDSNGILFYGLLQNNSVVYVNTTAVTPTSDAFSKEVLLAHNDVDLQWPDTFAFDDQGYLYTVTNRLQRYSTDSCDWSEINFRVARIFIGSLSYQYGKDDKVRKSEIIGGNEMMEHSTNPTNLDNNAPDTPVGVEGRDFYNHGHGDDGNQLGDGSNDAHHHSHQLGHANGAADPKGEPASSAPTVNEHLPVVLFLTVLMYNPMLHP